MTPAAALPLALVLAVLVASPVQAQAQKVFRCVDQNGKTYYTEQPGPSCKPVRIDAPAKPAPAAKPMSPVPSKARAKASAAAPLTLQAHCEGLAREAARMDSGKSSLEGSAAATRRAGIGRELDRSCPR